MTCFSTTNADCGIAKIQGYGKLIILQFFFLLFTASQIKGTEIRFVESDKLKIIQKPANYLKICHKNDTNFDQCLKSSLEKFMKSVNEGSSEYEIPSIDPVEIPLLEFQEGFTNFTCDVVLKPLNISGFKNFKILKVSSSVEDYKFEISLETPSIDIKAKLFTECDLYTFPISMGGLFSMKLTDVFAVLIIQLDTYKSRSDLSYFKIYESMMEVLPISVNMNFENFSEGSNESDSELDDFFKKNGQELFVYLKPITQRILANVSEAIANEILSRHPQQTLLPD